MNRSEAKQSKAISTFDCPPHQLVFFPFSSIHIDIDIHIDNPNKAGTRAKKLKRTRSYFIFFFFFPFSSFFSSGKGEAARERAGAQEEGCQDGVGAKAAGKPF